MKKSYEAWIQFYMEFADKLRFVERKDLIARIKKVYGSIGMRLPTLERGEWVDTDPFTVFGLFNKGITNTNRISIITGLAKEFDVKADVPQNFDGIPVLNNQSATFYYFAGDRGEHDIDRLWDFFFAALDYADDANEKNKQRFVNTYDTVILQRGVKWNLTMGLFWIRPYFYLNLDSRNRWFILDEKNMPSDFVNSMNKLIAPPSGEEYLNIIEKCNTILATKAYAYDSFPELSCYAWRISEEVNEQNRLKKLNAQIEETGNAIGDAGVATMRYWMYTPGYGAEMWDMFYVEGIMGIAREYIGDLSVYETRADMQKALQAKGEKGRSYKHASLETWQFVHDIKPGDVIFAKRGQHEIIGRGIVESDYYYDEARDSLYKNLRQVKWTHKGSWKHPDGSAITKVLTDVTSYTEYVAKLNALFDEDDVQQEMDEPVIAYPVYTADDFLSEVYMPCEEYSTLVNLIRTKKNIILQGAPGVGKTYAAKRLAYSMMGVKDQNRVMMVQFHQGYSYEDFIEGYRPAANGFVLNKGAFYKFCKTAEMDDENEYFFIIDEINRGNLSKIFGELFMLIEGDKRGIQLQLLYSGEKFAVPKNVYIIGMMNTADRSLAMLDYALRRRFAFYEMRPGFDTDGFRNYRINLNSDKFDRLIHCVDRLNTAIAADESLGDGFCVGHSYFCNLTAEKITNHTLTSIIEYELIPLLKEYWFDEPLKVKEWTNNLRSAIK
ncbi:MAG: AAA family ATPase [Clostridiales bacterium]|nr:AAA family ATPase [Clostridiales bacterium]